MKTIRDTKLFNEISDLTETEEQAWNVLFDDYNPKNIEIPWLCGGIDHIDRKEKGIYFHDRGCNGKDNSFVIRPEL